MYAYMYVYIRSNDGIIRTFKMVKRGEKERCRTLELRHGPALINSLTFSFQIVKQCLHFGLGNDRASTIKPFTLVISTAVF